MWQVIEGFFTKVCDWILNAFTSCIEWWWGWVSADWLSHLFPRLAITICCIVLVPLTYKLCRFVIKKI